MKMLRHINFVLFMEASDFKCYLDETATALEHCELILVGEGNEKK